MIEKNGMGLNLTWEVRDGILNHRTSCKPSTMEGLVVRLSDKIAYTNHDIDDAVRAGVIKDIPEKYKKVLGDTSSSRINAMIRDTIANSEGIRDIKMSESMKETLGGLREFMFKTVYLSDTAIKEKEKVKSMISRLYFYYLEHTDQMEEEFVRLIKNGEHKDTVVCDYIACMTDRFAIATFKRLFIPSSWSIY